MTMLISSHDWAANLPMMIDVHVGIRLCITRHACSRKTQSTQCTPITINLPCELVITYKCSASIAGWIHSIRIQMAYKKMQYMLLLVPQTDPPFQHVEEGSERWVHLDSTWPSRPRPGPSTWCRMQPRTSSLHLQTVHEYPIDWIIKLL